MEKSHVGMGHNICPICTKKHSEAVLIDKRLKNTLTKDMFMGWEFCPEHKEQEEDGYVFLIGIDEEKSEEPYMINTVYRTGSIVAVKKAMVDTLFDKPKFRHSITFCSEEVINKLDEAQKNL